MSHQPFETWILDQESLPMADRRALQAHMDQCPQCQRLFRKWGSARQELQARHMVAPAPGFTQRWKSSLVERRAQAQRKQAWRIFGILTAAAFTILLMLVAYVLTFSSPTDWLIALVRTLSTTSSLLSLGVYAVRTWLASTPLAVNIVLWVYLTVTFCILSLLWLLILWRTNILGVITQWNK